jgi:PDDEXK-like domain of unknown function (DUF3799)
VTVIELDPTGGAVVADMPHEEYLRHPALSASGAKLLVQPGGPARYRHQREHGSEPRRAFDVGHAVHAAVLGVDPGTELVMCTPTKRNGDPDGDPFPALDYKTRSAQDHRDAIRAAGRIPVLASDLVLADDMAAALRRHDLASRLLHPDSGRPEVSLFWRDPEHGVDRRCRVDWLRNADTNGRLLLVDYKTCASAAPDAVDRAIGNYGYHLSGAWYRDLIVGLGLASSVPVVLVFQETSAPYLVHVVELDDQWLRIGEDLTRRALTTFRECTESGRWPGYEGITLSTPPPWLVGRHDAAGFEAWS